MLALIIYAGVSIPENKGDSLAKTEDKMVGLEKKQEQQINNAYQEDTNVYNTTVT